MALQLIGVAAKFANCVTLSPILHCSAEPRPGLCDRPPVVIYLSERKKIKPFLLSSWPAEDSAPGVHRSFPVDDEPAAARGKPMVKPSLSLLALAAQAARRAAPRLRKAPIELTDAAAERVRELLGKRDKVTSRPVAMPPAPSTNSHLAFLAIALLKCPNCHVLLLARGTTVAFCAGLPAAGSEAAWLQWAVLHSQLCRCAAIGETGYLFCPHSLNDGLDGLRRLLCRPAGCLRSPVVRYDKQMCARLFLCAREAR